MFGVYFHLFCDVYQQETPRRSFSFKMFKNLYFQGPFKTITSANMLIQKAVFLAVNDVKDDLYGLDYYFTAKLKARKTWSFLSN